MRSRLSFFVLIGLCLFSSQARASDPALACQAGKLKAAGKYDACRLGEYARSVTTGEAPDFNDCDQAFADRWIAIEMKADPVLCPTEGDDDVISTRAGAHTEALQMLVSGNDAPDCGASQRFVATGQTRSFGRGDDGAVQAGATLAYVDNADGTITDKNSGLMWEKKVGWNGEDFTICADETGSCANPHLAQNVYSWSAGGDAYDGHIVTILLEQLNNRCNDDTSVACASDSDCVAAGGECGFAGFRDWRLPNKREMESIVDTSSADPAVSSAFHAPGCSASCVDLTDPDCSCTVVGLYWTSTTTAREAVRAWNVFFSDGYPEWGMIKSQPLFARAVRGGF